MVFFLFEGQRCTSWAGGRTTAKMVDFSERMSIFSLKYRAIRPSTVFGTRRKVALRVEGFAWVPDLGSFLKLREVGVSPYLDFIHSLSTLSMFELNEIVRARLIGPKTWDRIDIIFETIMEQPVTVHG